MGVKDMSWGRRFWEQSKNPFNGKDCFFSESTFNLVMGPGPSFEDKLLSQIARMKSEKQKHNTQTNVSKPKSKSEQKYRPSEAVLVSNVVVNQHITEKSDLSISQDFHDKAEVARFSNRSQKCKPAKILNCELVSDTTTISAPVRSDKHSDLDKLKPEKSEQNGSDPKAKLIKNVEVNKEISLKPSPTDASTDQNVDTRSNISNSSSISNNQSESCQLEVGPKPIYTSVKPVLIDQCLHIHMDSSTYLTNTESGYRNDTGLMMDFDDVTERKTQVPVLEGCSAPEETQSPASIPKITNELCLVMPSLSSDDDDNYSDFSICPTDLVAPAPKENQPLLIMPISLTGDSASIPTTDLSSPFLEFGNSNEDASSFNKDYDYSGSKFKIDTEAGQSCHSFVHSPERMETQTNPLYQQHSDQANSSGSTNHFSLQYQPTSAPTLLESDIPIFSVRESLPETMKFVKSISINQEMKNVVKLTCNEDQQQSGKLSVQNIATKEAVNSAPNFKKSGLTRAEHEAYLKLYNKYVRAFMQGGPPPILTDMQRTEISSFEKLHRRVLNEQAEFQNYLQENARKNPHSYSFLKPVARNYASSKARSYRLKSNYVESFDQALLSQIPFLQETACAELKFQQMLLEVPVSLDKNVRKLAARYDFQVVMSSSVLKCLLDNHSPSFNRAWNIPVSVTELDLEGTPKRIVYLDKPIFENGLHMRDYSTLFHKYALRTFMSYPKNRHAQDTMKHFHQTTSTEMPSTLDDPFDMFSSNVDSLETFGTGPSISANTDSKTPQVVPKKCGNKLDNSLSTSSPPQHAVEGAGFIQPASQKFSTKILRSNKNVFNDWDAVCDDLGRHNTSDTPPSRNADKCDSYSDTMAPKRSCTKTSGAQLDGNVVTLLLGDSGSEGEPKKKPASTSKNNRKGNTSKCQPCLTVTDSCTLTQADKFHERAELNCTSHAYSHHTASSPFVSPSSPSVGDQDCSKLISSRDLIQEIPISPTTETPFSPTRETPFSPVKETPFSPTREAPFSPTRETPFSPVKEAPFSPTREAPFSPTRETPFSPVKETPFSPTREAPFSPTRETPFSPNRETPFSPTREAPFSPTRETPFSPTRETPFSPTREAPFSPTRETPFSPTREAPFSPTRETPFSLTRDGLPSLVKEIPLSPVKEASPPTIHAGQSHLSQCAPCGRSPHQTTNRSSTNPDLSASVPRSTRSVNETHTSFPRGAQNSSLFTPLDSILGPSFGQQMQGKHTQSIAKEDPCHYLPPKEVHSSIVYNVWSLHSMNVLIRVRCHGIVKDIKKTRRVYFSPKMEYQTTHGLEQVTVNEVAKEWTSCFVRPNTNLLRARINAFTSEIVMFEELETGQILPSSLNFQPEAGFEFLDQVLQCVLSLKCGKYLLSHEPGDTFCGIRGLRIGARTNNPEDNSVPTRKMSTDSQFRWIPIDPTILLPYHIANNRIPATFLPKDVEVKNFSAGGSKRKNPVNNNDSSTNSHWKKWKKKGNKKSRKSAS